SSAWGRRSRIADRSIEERDLVVRSGTVPPTQVGLIVRVEGASSGDTSKGAKASAPADVAIVGAVARRRIFTNEPISPDQLIQRGDRSIGSAVVSPGMRAVSIGISAASASGGFIPPGDYVDVILSMEFKQATDENGNKLPDGAATMLPDGDSIVKVSTETVLRNVKVLAIDQKLGRAAEEGPADVGKTATLEVSLADTE